MKKKKMLINAFFFHSIILSFTISLVLIFCNANTICFLTIFLRLFFWQVLFIAIKSNVVQFNADTGVESFELVFTNDLWKRKFHWVYLVTNGWVWFENICTFTKLEEIKMLNTPFLIFFTNLHFQQAITLL